MIYRNISFDQFYMIDALSNFSETSLHAKEIIDYIESCNFECSYYPTDLLIINLNKIECDGLIEPVEYNIDDYSLTLNYSVFDRDKFVELISIALKASEMSQEYISSYKKNKSGFRKLLSYDRDKNVNDEKIPFKTLYDSLSIEDFENIYNFQLTKAYQKYEHRLKYRNDICINFLRNILFVYILKQI